VELHQSFAALRRAIEDARKISLEAARHKEDFRNPFTLTVTNRLFGQEGFAFREL